MILSSQTEHNFVRLLKDEMECGCNDPRSTRIRAGGVGHRVCYLDGHNTAYSCLLGVVES